METVLRSLTVYFLLMLLFRLTGKRSLGEITTFDFILLLIISEATDSALLGENHSVANSTLTILTLVFVDVGLSFLKQRLPALERYIDGLPVVILENGKPLKRRMAKNRIDEDDILAAARESQGLEKLSQIKFAVLECNGSISIIPQRS